MFNNFFCSYANRKNIFKNSTVQNYVVIDRGQTKTFFGLPMHVYFVGAALKWTNNKTIGLTHR